MSAGHTPGPWVIAYVHADGTSIAIDDEQGMEGARDYDLVTVTHGDPNELLANARLIAAAPELLEALQAWDAWESGLISGMVERRERAQRLTRAAIAKATGSES